MLRASFHSSLVLSRKYDDMGYRDYHSDYIGTTVQVHFLIP